MAGDLLGVVFALGVAWSTRGDALVALVLALVFVAWCGGL